MEPEIIQGFEIIQESYATIIKIKIDEKDVDNVYIHAYDNHIELHTISSDEEIMRYNTNYEARMSWAEYGKGYLDIIIPIERRGATDIRIIKY